MLRFLYWAVIKATGEEVNFINENLFDIGEEVVVNEQVVSIVDFAIDENISSEELALQKGDMEYYA